MASASRYENMQQPHKDPNMAGMMSIIPGLGQFYNGETRKGFLFLLAGIFNFVIFLGILFNTAVLAMVQSFGENFSVRPNEQLIATMMEFTLGSPASLMMMGLFFTFIGFAMRDAFSHAAHRRRRAIYKDFILEMPEATSGSYLFHVALMGTFLFLAFFVLVPDPPKSQITDIEFIQDQEKVKKRPKTRRKAEHNSEDRGKHNPRKKVRAPSPAPKKRSQPRPKAAPKPVRQPQKSPSPSPKPTPKPSPRRPNLKPTLNRRPSPNPSPRPSPRPSPVRAPSPSPTPKASPLPFNLPNPFAKAPASPRAHSSPVPAPVSVGKVGAPSVPAPRIASASRGKGGLSPAPIAAIKTRGSSGGGGKRSPVPVMAGGGGSRGKSKGGGRPGPAPAPSRAGSGQGGGRKGPSLAAAPSVPAPRGGGKSGQGQKGNPGKNNKKGRPSLAAQKDVDFGPYMADLQRRIKRAWFPPKGNESKRVKVVFKVHRNGTMSHLRLMGSSGLAIADQAALKAVQNAAPFRPLPAGAPNDVDIQFTFDYNVFKSGGRARLRRNY